MLPFRDLIPSSTVMACALVLCGAGQSWKEIPFFSVNNSVLGVFLVGSCSQFQLKSPGAQCGKLQVNPQQPFRNQHSLICISLDLSCYKKKIVCYRFADWLTFSFLGLLYAELPGLGPENFGTNYQKAVGHPTVWGSCHHSQQGWFVLVRQVESCQPFQWDTELVLGHFYLFYGQCRTHSSLDWFSLEKLNWNFPFLLFLLFFSFTRAWDPSISPFSGRLCRDSCQL